MEIEQHNHEIAALFDEYQRMHPILTGFANEFHHQLVTVLQRRNVSLGFPIQKRVKSWESIAEKQNRLGNRFSKLTDIQDLIGFRIVLLFVTDVTLVAESVGEEFHVVRRYDTAEKLAEDQFGYSSLHIVARMPSEWTSVPSLSDFGEIQAEIQIRTVAQHLWAEVSHQLQYRQESSVPSILRRGLHRVSALLETADLEFERVMESRAEYRKLPLDGISADTKLDVDLLERLLALSLPQRNRGAHEEYGELLRDLKAFGIDTVAMFRDLIDSYLEAALKEDQRIVQGFREGDKTITKHYRGDKKKIDRGEFYQHVGLVRYMLGLKFGVRWETYSKSNVVQFVENEDETA